MKLLKLLKLYTGNFMRKLYFLFYRINGINIGSNTYISFGAKLDITRGRICIGYRCTITHGCVILSHDPTARRLGKDNSEGITIIEDDVFIGVNSVVLMGVKIGCGAIIAAGSVVSRDIPPYSVYCSSIPRILKNHYVDCRKYE